jgi:NADH-quinone oxidoreductase subunit L
MSGPLLILAIPAALSGFGFFAAKFLHVPHADEGSHIVPILATAAMLIGVVVAFVLYRNREADPISVGAFRNRLYFDDLYAWLIRWTQELLASISAFIDRWILDAGAVRGASTATWGFGALLRLLQVGNLQAYAFLFGLGIVGLIYFTVFR